MGLKLKPGKIFSKPLKTMASTMTLGGADLFGAGIINEATGLKTDYLKDLLGPSGALGSQPTSLMEGLLPPELKDVLSKARKIQASELDRLAATGAAADPEALARAEGEKMLLEQQLGQIPALTALTSKELGATAGIEDQRRSLREKIAQRGLSNSSIGIAGEQVLRRQQNEMFQDIKAGRIGLEKEKALGKQIVDKDAARRLRAMKLGITGEQAGLAGSILGQPGAIPDTIVTGGRPSLIASLLPFAGAGIGGILGGASSGVGAFPGAMFGYGAGTAAGQYF